MIWRMEILKIRLEEQLLINYNVIKYSILLKIWNMMDINVDTLHLSTNYLIKNFWWCRQNWNHAKWKITWRNLQSNNFFYRGFLSRPFTNHRTAGKGGWHFFNSSLTLPPASQTLTHSLGNYCWELTSAHR